MHCQESSVRQQQDSGAEGRAQPGKALTIGRSPMWHMHSALPHDTEAQGRTKLPRPLQVTCVNDTND